MLDFIYILLSFSFTAGFFLIRFRITPTLYIFSVFTMFSIIIPYLVFAFTGNKDVLVGDLGAYFAVEQSVNIAFVSLFGVLIGYGLRSLFSRGQNRPVEGAKVGRSSLSIIRKLNYFIYVVLGALYIINPLGPLGLIEAAFRRIPLQGSIFSSIYALAVLGSLVSLFITIEQLNNGRRPPYGMIAISVIMMWIMGGRVQFVITVAPYLLLLSSLGRLSLRVVAVTVMFAGGLSTLTLLFRYQAQTGESRALGSVASDFAAQGEMMSSYNVAQQYVGYYGFDPMLYLRTVLQLVPRSIYEDKPQQLTALLRYFIRGDDLGGLTIGVFGEFYVIGGLLSCLVLGGLYGFAIASLDKAFRNSLSASSRSKMVVYSLIVMLSVYCMRAGFDSAVFRFAFLGVAWTAITFLSRTVRSGTKRQRRSQKPLSGFKAGRHNQRPLS